MTDYYLTPKAQKDLIDIARHTLKLWGKKQRDDYLRLLARGFERLVTLPHAGRPCDDLSSTLRAYDCQQHVIYYRADNGNIQIIRILHQRQDRDSSIFNA